MTTQEMIEVLTAYQIGREIQCRILDSDSAWIVCGPDPVWNFGVYEYRVSREPRVFFVVDYGVGVHSGLITSREQAVSLGNDCGKPYDIVQLVEVVQ